MTVDDASFPVEPEWANLGLDAIGHVMDAAVARVGQVARVDVTMPDGSTMSEIVTPDEPAAGARTDAPPPAPVRGPVPTSAGGSFLGVAEPGFRPGEKVSIAVVVASSVATREGVAALRMPPGLLARRPFTMVLLGHDSGYLVVHDPTLAAGQAGAA
ncbi:hypothetical protein [Xylanimonas protaetiae]|uniref:hypothetical protein n=1 Tax=Xylanimonas protaetiae TaxID=2509457 RepID=UPI001F5DB1DB|nr:hypothetical protein [Xylanimonas protaetiae]